MPAMPRGPVSTWRSEDDGVGSMEHVESLVRWLEVEVGVETPTHAHSSSLKNFLDGFHKTDS